MALCFSFLNLTFVDYHLISLISYLFIFLAVYDLFMLFSVAFPFVLHLKQSTLTEESKSAYNLLIEKPSVETTSLPVEPVAAAEPEDSNPLRMLRSGGLTVVRPKIRGNKHQLQTLRDSRELKVQQQLREFFLLLLLLLIHWFSYFIYLTKRIN